MTNRYMQTLQFYFHATMLVLIYAYCFLTRMILATLHNMYTPLSSFTLTCSLLCVRVWPARLMETLFDACLVALVALESISPGKGTYYGTLRCCTLPSKENFPRHAATSSMVFATDFSLTLFIKAVVIVYSVLPIASMSHRTSNLDPVTVNYDQCCLQTHFLKYGKFKLPYEPKQ